MKEISDDRNKLNDIPCLWIGRMNIVKMPGLHKAICKFSKISIKILISMFHRTTNSKICMKTQRPWLTKTILRKKNNARSITFPQTIPQRYSNQTEWS